MKIALWFIRRTLPFWWILVVLIIPIARVCQTVDWSWVAVTLPLWLPMATVVLLPGLALLFVILVSLYKSITR
ncbi:hypothetical protein GO730_20925 [Spirosoma sp. HMF3257]|uniref:Uncharacterized protein n=1 Tax=Spirosoma telluris TaxID=2183553 RepID=A0A327NLD5_9BACT|nr:hypothetical protein [Spirosoma telluris]RAI76012.1 hypothetical protein HMF3257_20850 [Spirosoma telluris]